MLTYYSNVGAAQVLARICTGIWDAWCIFSCLMFLTVNNETVTHYLKIIYVTVERANFFCKVAWVYILYHNNVLCKMFYFKRLSNVKTQAVFFILKLLIKLVYAFISQNTKKFRFYENSTLFSVNFNENSEQS